jgi:hypothetical protein
VEPDAGEEEIIRRFRYVAQGGDVGAGVTDAMGRQAPEGLLGIHMNLLVTALGGPQPTDTVEERAAADAITTFTTSGNGYFIEQATRPQTINAVLDLPVALAAWMLDHDTDAYYKIARAFVDGQPVGNLTRDHILDNITLYLLTGTGASAARSYWESYGAPAVAAAAGQALRRSRSRSASPRSPVSSGGPRAAGLTSRTRTSSISTRSTRAATSLPGKSLTSSAKRFVPHSNRFARYPNRHMPSLDGATDGLTPSHSPRRVESRVANQPSLMMPGGRDGRDRRRPGGGAGKAPGRVRANGDG